MIPRINTYVCKLTSKNPVAEEWLDVSVRYTSYCLGCCALDWFSVGEITITLLEYEILIQKIIFLFRGDFIVSRFLDKTLTTFPREEKSLSVVAEFPCYYGYDFDKMIIVTNEGDFLLCCDEQTKQKIDEHIDYKKLYRQRKITDYDNGRESDKYFKDNKKEFKN